MSLVNAFMLSFERALARVASRLGASLVPTWARTRATRESPSRRAYHTPNSVSAANSRIASRYWRAVASTAFRRSAGFSWPSRPATSMLAARRFTSHSHGPGRVSSKSFTSNSKERSGRGEAAEVEQVSVPAALHPEPRGGRGGQVGGHDRRRPSVERERRDHHPPVTDRHQVGLPRGGLLSDDVDRAPAPGRRCPTGVERARDGHPGGLTLALRLLGADVVDPFLQRAVDLHATDLAHPGRERLIGDVFDVGRLAVPALPGSSLALGRCGVATRFSSCEICPSGTRVISA